MFTKVLASSPLLRKTLPLIDTDLVFKPGVNLLVGANGCGKTRLMEKLSSLRSLSAAEQDLIEIAFEGRRCNVLHHDFEKGNPRTADMDAAIAEGRGLQMLVAKMATAQRSHGEAQRRLFANLKASAPESTVAFFDEPEQGLDAEGVQVFVEQVLSQGFYQCFVATHCPYLILDPRYHVVELVPGYLAKLRNSLSLLLNSAKPLDAAV